MIRDLYQRAQRLTVNLWTLIAPPTVWSLHFLFCYVYAAIHCAKAGRLESIAPVQPAIAVATVLSLLLVGASGYVGWAQSRAPGDPPPHEESTDEDRHR